MRAIWLVPQCLSVLASLALTLVFAAPPPAHSQTLKECTVGMHVVDGAGVAGVITGPDGIGMCDLRLDKDGSAGMRSLYALSPAAAAKVNMSAPLPNGAYDCSSAAGSSWNHPGIAAMGYVDISGNTYRMRPYGKVSQGFAPFSIAADGAIRWRGHLGALDIAPSRVIESHKTSATSFNVKYQIKPNALIETMSCRHL